MRTEEITLSNPTLDREVRRLRQIDSDLSSTRRTLMGRESELLKRTVQARLFEYLADNIGEITPCLPDAPNNLVINGSEHSIPDYAKTYVNNNKRLCRSEISTLKTRVGNSSSLLRELMTSRLKTLENIDAQKSRSAKLSTLQLKEMLSEFEVIDKKSIWVGTDSIGNDYVRWVQKASTTPYKNKYLNLNGRVPFPIQLPDVIVTVYPSRNKVTLLRKRNSPIRNSPGYSRARQVHPHITDSSGTPCLGDFQGPFVDALDANDWGTVAGIINLFLETTNDDDGAGLHWPNFIFQMSMQMRHIIIGDKNYYLKYLMNSQYLYLKERHPNGASFPVFEGAPNVVPIISNNGDTLEFMAYTNVDSLEIIKARLTELFLSNKE